MHFFLTECEIKATVVLIVLGVHFRLGGSAAMSNAVTICHMWRLAVYMCRHCSLHEMWLLSKYFPEAVFFCKEVYQIAAL